MDYNTVGTIAIISFIAAVAVPLLITILFHEQEFSSPAALIFLAIFLIIFMISMAMVSGIEREAKANLKWKEQVVEIVEIDGPPKGYEVKTFNHQGYTMKYVKITDDIVAVVNDL